MLILLFGWIVLGICLLLAASVLLAQVAQQIPHYQEQLAKRLASVEAWIMTTFGVQVDFGSSEPAAETARNGVINLRDALGEGLVILGLTLLLLLEAPALREKLRAGVGSANQTLAQFSEASGNVKTYMRIYSQSSVVNALVLTIWLLIFRIDYAIVWGLVALVLSYIPYLGTTIAVLPAIFLAWIQYGLGTAALVTLGVILINTYFGQVTTNQAASRRLNLSLLAVFLSVIFWTWVLGPPGALLGVPLTAMLKIVLQRYRQTRWAAMLMTSIIGIQSAQAARETHAEGETQPPQQGVPTEASGSPRDQKMRL